MSHAAPIRSFTRTVWSHFRKPRSTTQLVVLHADIEQCEYVMFFSCCFLYIFRLCVACIVKRYNFCVKMFRLHICKTTRSLFLFTTLVRCVSNVCLHALARAFDFVYNYYYATPHIALYNDCDHATPHIALYNDCDHATPHIALYNDCGVRI